MNMACAKAIGADKEKRDQDIGTSDWSRTHRAPPFQKLSQQKLADRLGYDVSHVRQTEMGGNPTLEFLDAIGHILFP